MSEGNQEIDYIQLVPYRFRQAFFGEIAETDLTTEEFHYFRLFKLGALFMQEYMTIWANVQLDSEAAKDRYNELFRVEKNGNTDD